MNLSKTNLSGNKQLVILFLRKLYSRRIKNSYKKNLTVNYFIYKFFFYNFSKVKSVFLYRHYMNLQKYSFINPSFMFKKQFFAKNTDFNNILISYNIRGFFFHKKFKNLNKHLLVNNLFYYDYLFGYNYYIYNNDILNKYLILDNNNDLFKVKLINELNNFEIDFNFFFNYNIFLLNILEIYKIIILLNLYNLK